MFVLLCGTQEGSGERFLIFTISRRSRAKQRHLNKGYEGYSSGFLSSVQTGHQAGCYMCCSNVLMPLPKRIRSASQKP